MAYTAGKCRYIFTLIMCFTLVSCAYIEDFRSEKERDSNVARNVKSHLIKSPAVEAAPLRVRVEGKIIVLNGFVESLEEKQEAEIVARELYPAFELLNYIRVR